MAENSKLTGIELNGVFYSLGKPVYEEIGVSLERFAELLGRDLYCPTLSAAPTSSTLTYTDTDGSTNTFQVGQPCRWAEGSDYRIAVCKNITASAASWYVLPVKVSELTNDAGYVKNSELASVARSGSYNDLSNKPTIPSAVTETTVSGWGFTKNTGTITGIKMNGASKGTSGVVDLGTVITAHQDISGKLDSSVAASTYSTKTEMNAKQDKSLKFTNLSASSWVSDSTYAEFPYRCDISCSGVTADMYAEVAFGMEQAASGNYAPICETKAGVVSVWSKGNTSITVPTIIVTK